MSNFFRVLSGVQLIAKAQLKHYNKPKIYPTFQGKIFHNQFQKELKLIESPNEFKKTEGTQIMHEKEEILNVEPKIKETRQEEYQKNEIEPKEMEVEKKIIQEEIESMEDKKLNQIERKVPSNPMTRLMNFSRFKFFPLKNQSWGEDGIWSNE
jgi:hypothetical protein